MFNLEQVRQNSIEAMLSIDIDQVRLLAQRMIFAIQAKRQIITCGNGGSAAHASHLVGELIGRYRLDKRWPVRAVCLNTDQVVTTALANDFGYEHVFSKQIDSICGKDDVLIAFSTSGKSQNITYALSNAKAENATTCLITGDMSSHPDAQVIRVRSTDTPRIQEAHQLILHMLCELLDEALT